MFSEEHKHLTHTKEIKWLKQKCLQQINGIQH
jgi:hypothetical protein